jgi:hypothetical protein
MESSKVEEKQKGSGAQSRAVTRLRAASSLKGKVKVGKGSGEVSGLQTFIRLGDQFKILVVRPPFARIQRSTSSDQHAYNFKMSTASVEKHHDEEMGGATMQRTVTVS